MFRVQKMTTSDFPFAVELANTLGWDMSDVDFAYMSTLEPDGCFMLWHGNERVGMATCVSYGSVGWFGNLAVNAEFRRKGAGTLLLEHAIEYLKAKGASTVGLYAYQRLVGFYGKVGFKPVDDFVVLKGMAKKLAGNGKGVAKVEEKDLSALAQFDKSCGGWDRRRLIESVLLEEGNLGYYVRAEGEFSGFAMAKVYGEMAEIGPLVCTRAQGDLAVQLVNRLINETNGLEVYAYVSASEKTLLDVLFNAGLREQFRVTRMFLGSFAAESCVYMPESLERG